MSSQKKNPPALFTVRENAVRAQLGLNKDEVRARRTYFLAQGCHWDYVDKRVLYAPVGVQILRDTLQSDIPREDAPGEDSATPRRPIALLPEKNPPPVEFHGELVVWRCATLNQTILTAYIPGVDPNNPLNLVTVIVRSNENFLPGMKLTRLNPLGENRYELVGPCPRWRGRW